MKDGIKTIYLDAVTAEKLDQLAKEEGFESVEVFLKHLVTVYPTLRRLKELFDAGRLGITVAEHIGKEKRESESKFAIAAGKIGAIIPVFHVISKDPALGQDPREADIQANADFAKKHGFVYWDVNIPWIVSLKKHVPTCIYFYEASLVGRGFDVVQGPRAVTWCAELVDIITLDELTEKSEEVKYIPPWRRQCFEGVWTNSEYAREKGFVGKKHPPTKYWLKLRNFRPIGSLPLEYFLKPNGERFKSPRGGFIMCPEGNGNRSDEDQITINGRIYTLGDQVECPVCGKRYWCNRHRYIYKKWFSGYRAVLTGRNR